MALATINAGSQFPVGTTVQAFLVSSGRPIGGAVSSAVVAADSSLTFSGLADGTSFVAYVKVNGEDRFVKFNTDAVVVSAGSGGGTDPALAAQVTALSQQLAQQQSVNVSQDLGIAEASGFASQALSGVDSLASVLGQSGRLFIQETEPLDAVAPCVWIRTDASGAAQEMLIKRP